MSHVFISYKSDDRPRVARLVNALERNGLSVWWDSGLAAGDEWRASIERALDAAGCVIVVWTRASTGPDGGFVRDEAARANARGILLPVRLDPVTPPLGFGELQAIDLTHWRASARDPFLKDLVTAARAKIAGRPVPPARAPMIRMMRRVAATTGATALLLAAWGAGTNVFGVQERLCGVPWGQPAVSDACGALRLGNRPGRTERVAWQNREAGSCAALRDHIAAFPDGVYRDTAADLLGARRVSIDEHWTPAEYYLPLLIGRDAPASANRSAAEAAALERAPRRAELECRDYVAAASHLFQFTSAAAEPREWNCTSLDDGGVVCGFRGRAVCTLQARVQQERESCEVKR
jgi:hypothetical protein